MSEKVKFLFLSASPKDWEEVEADKEFRKIFENHDDRQILLLSISNTQINKLYDVLLKNKPEIVHFSGHGVFDEILLENTGENSKGITKDALTDLFRKLPKKPKLLFLNACWTALNIENLRQTIDIVVASRKAVSDIAASMFADRFYSALFSGADVKTAFELAKSYFNANGSKDEVEMYELFTRQREFETTVFFQDINKSEAAASTPDDKFNVQIGTIKGKEINFAGGNIYQINIGNK